MKNWLKKKSKGLTLVELLAVIVILGIVAAIAVPAISGVITRSKTDADAQTVLLIQDAAYKYAIAEKLTSSTTSVSVSTLATSGYLKEVPKVNSDTSKAYTTVALTIASDGGVTVGAVSTGAASGG